MTIPVLNEAQSHERDKNFTVNRLIQKVTPLINGLTSIAANTFLGNNTASTAAPIALTTTQAKALLAIGSGDVSGLAASATTDTTNAANISSGTLNVARLPLTEATAAEYQGNTSGFKALAPERVWSAVGDVALTDGSTIAVDMSTGFNFSVSIAGNRTLSNATNAKPGQSGCFKITASSADRTIDVGTQYLFTSDLSFPVTITSGTAAYIFYFVDTSTRVLITSVLNNPA